MNLVISIYSKNAFCEYLLPAVNNTDHSICIRKDSFGLGRDLYLNLEVIDGEWKMRSTPSCRLEEDGRSCFACTLFDGQIIMLNTAEGESLTAVITSEESFHHFSKYDISGLQELHIGREDRNDIRYDFEGRVSRKHAGIIRQDGVAKIENYSRNGVYVNGERVAASRELRFGDYINIIGLHMVYLGRQLAVDTSRRDVIVSSRLRSVENTPEYTVVYKWNKAPETVKTMYHRPPRFYAAPAYDESGIMTEIYPDPSVWMSSNAAYNSIWSRNRSHNDFLVHRIGTESTAAEGARETPVTIDLEKHKILGITCRGDRQAAAGIARALSLQIAASNCYTDVKLGYVYNNETSADYSQWDFARWLPHVWSEGRKTRLIASDRREAAEVFDELTDIFRKRKESRDRNPAPYYVIFISDPSMLEGELFSRYIAEKDPVCGLTAILLAESLEQLPNSCDYILQKTDSFSGGYGAYGSNEARRSIDFDTVKSEQLEAFARRISSFRVTEESDGSELPEVVSFLEMLNVSSVHDLSVKEKWAKSRTYESLQAQIGVKPGGVPCFLDAHERHHGPHGLIAGMTGSGKSEALQTYILSLAVNYSPRDVSFFIIDYKGGGMANLFEGLPHLAGSITNLSGNRVRRAMTSIKSEIRRRQQLFNINNVNNINNYTRLYKNGDAGTPLPHLFIIVDEFAELKKEQPEFMKELISVAQLGRSLGIHLILSTQKPGGTVDDNIWSNSRFRISFRVQDRQDSQDVLRKPDAAFLTDPGRGYLQVGTDEIYEPFKAGYSGALYDEKAGKLPSDFVKMISSSGRIEMKGSAAGIQHNGLTELDAVRDHLIEAAEMYGYDHARRLWLPELPDTISLDELNGPNARGFKERGDWNPSGADQKMSFILGRWDDPANQTQEVLAANLMECGNIAICGSPASGKSTMMQTIAFSLINRYSPDEISIYALDFSSHMMGAFERAPHMGCIMFEEDRERIEKFFRRIMSLLKERKELLRGGSYRQYRMSHNEKLPALVIMIDNYATFRDRFGEKFEPDVMRLAREGIGNGIFLIISGGGFGINEIPGRIADNLNTVFTLSLQDRYAYADALHSMRIEVLPEHGISGRGLALCGDRVLEYQTALALDADNDYVRMEKIYDICCKMADSWGGKRAQIVPEIPDRPDWELFSGLDSYKEMRDEGKHLPVGYRADDASVCGLPLSELFCFGVYGERKTGKTNFLRTCLAAAADRGGEVCVIDDTKETLGMFKKCGGISYCSTDREIFEYFKGIVPEIQKRSALKNKLLEKDLEGEALLAEMMKETVPVFIFISDLAGFTQTIYESDFEMRGFVENLFEKGSGQNIYLFAELAPEKRYSAAGLPAFEQFTGYRTGIRLGGRVIDDPILTFDHLGYAEKTAVYKPGTGMVAGLHNIGEALKVVTPLTKLTQSEIAE